MFKENRLAGCVLGQSISFSIHSNIDQYCSFDYYDYYFLFVWLITLSSWWMLKFSENTLDLSKPWSLHAVWWYVLYILKKEKTTNHRPSLNSGCHRLLSNIMKNSPSESPDHFCSPSRGGEPEMKKGEAEARWSQQVGETPSCASWTTWTHLNRTSPSHRDHREVRIGGGCLLSCEGDFCETRSFSASLEENDRVLH